MSDHPFTNSTFSKATGTLLVLTAIFIQWALLVLYVPIPYGVALVDSTLFIGLLAAAGFTGWYFILQVRVWQAQAGAAMLVQLLCLAVTCSVLVLTGIEDTDTFLAGLPLRFLPGILYWIILFQWYRQQATAETEESPEADMPSPSKDEIIDRISVKDGPRIHIIHTDELFCIRASGDYVTLFTPGGQYIKEQTMKYFETHLPPSNFVRIHRSSIINTDYILRVELFDKNSYRIKLKNGINLKASSSGYKLLKEKLHLN